MTPKITYEEFVEEVKNFISNQKNPPKYNPENWKNKSFNCYLYVLQACMDFSVYEEYLHMIVPGFLSRNKIENKTYKDTENCVIERFEDDLKALGFQAVPTTLEERISKKEYKIAVYVKENFDYHFARQDSNGKWSEKDGWDNGIKIIRNFNNITKTINGYKYIAMYKVSKKAK